MYRVTHKEWDFNDGLKLFKIVLRMNQGLVLKYGFLILNEVI